MSMKLSKESYITLIENDIAMVETNLPDCLEQNHIEAVLRDSVNHYYPKFNKEQHPAQEENSVPINNSRIIKFRGKRLFNGEWAEGSYIQQDGIIVLDEGGEVEVDPDTVGQFTGLLDKNGNEIYEYDILSVCNGSINLSPWMDEPYFVEYQINKGFMMPMFLWDKNGNDYSNNTHWCEVIGNKFDNNELLKGDKE